MTKSYDAASLGSQTTLEDGSSSSSPDDFVFVTDEQGLPIRTNPPPSQAGMAMELHPISENNSLLVTVVPPVRPSQDIKHVSCDIVLVIDVSGSMSDPAPLPDVQEGDAQPEVSGLTILDLTKHAARTILETLNEGDRLAIVTFSQDAKIVQPLTAMTVEAKKQTEDNIEKLEDDAATNLWAGIKTGLQVIETSEAIGNVQGIYVLTDGMPNHMCPTQGYVAKLKPMMEEMARTRTSVPTIHTFGFGYNILSNLLQSIAEVGSGNYAFIPEAGMIGTVFVHAVANLYSTYATSAKLKLTASKDTALKCTSGLAAESPDPSELHLTLGNIQYGQSRDTIVLTDGPKASSHVTATLTYKLPSGDEKTIISALNLSHRTSVPQSLKDYHMHRNTLCTFLSNLFPLAPNGEHVRHIQPHDTALEDITNMAKSFESSSKALSDPNIVSLQHDLFPSAPGSQDGQISHALSTVPPKHYWHKWGRHYLPSLLHAHLRQQCNSFKDPGPLRYGVNSPLFIKCRDELDKAFDNLPSPKPSITGDRLQRLVKSVKGGHGRIAANFSMSRYNYAGNPCFLGSCTVKVAADDVCTGDQDSHQIRVEELRAGMKLLNPLTSQPREIVAVVKTAVYRSPDDAGRSNQKICRVGESCWITPYHPIFHRSTQKWTFPTDVAEETRDLREGEAVYSIILSAMQGSSNHAIEVEGIPCVTLGHGLVSSPVTETSTSTSSASKISQSPSDTITKEDDVRIHPFFGNHAAILSNIHRLPQNKAGIYLCAGVERQPANNKDETKRDEETSSTGLVSGFIPDHFDRDIVAPASQQVDSRIVSSSFSSAQGLDCSVFNLPALILSGPDGACPVAVAVA